MKTLYTCTLTHIRVFGATSELVRGDNSSYMDKQRFNNKRRDD